MKIPRIVFPCLLLVFSATLAFAEGAPPSIRKGELLFSLDASDARARGVRLPVGAEWVSMRTGDGVESGALKITVAPENAKGPNIVTLPIDLRPWRGARILLTCRAKADGVSVPTTSYNGIKCQLHWMSPSKGARWFNESHVYGTFDWRELSCLVAVDEDATTGYLNLGIQDSFGTAWLSEVRITAWQVKSPRPEPVAATQTVFKGHDLPRLRGVMSPVKFNRQDFSDLKALNVNCVRWQLVNRNWGKAGQDRDLAVYDRWLEGRLDELALVLDAAAQDGLKVVIDLHSPPGGRLADSTLRMVLEQEHQDHFVKVWERIARRFKDHPAVWAYDLINEPVQNRPSPPGLADAIGIQVLAAKAVRAIDPKTAILITPDQWSSPDAFPFFEPVDVPGVVYQAHMYWPGQFTHQGVNNAWGVESGNAPLAYPGSLDGRPLDKDALRRHLAPVREFQNAYGVHIYIGEFGTIRWSPGGAKYLEDCISIFEEYGWDWTYHAFREWPGWSVEHADLPYSMTDHPKAEQPTERARVLQKWFLQNARP